MRKYQQSKRFFSFLLKEVLLISPTGTSRQTHWVAVCLLVAVYLTAGGIREIRAQSVEKSYPLRQGQMKLQLPADWAEETKSPKPGAPLTLAFRPLQGARFLIRIVASWDENAGGSFNSDGRLQEITMAAGNQFLPRAVEKQLKLQEIKGESVRGYYFLLTDKAPRAGDYEVMAQGAASLDGALILFTYLGYPGGEAELQKLLSVLRGAGLTATALPRSQ
jgi:hypothetical protein